MLFHKSSELKLKSKQIPGASEKNINQPEIEIIPAILPKSFSHIEQEVDFVRNAINVTVDYVQIDIVDGMFAPTKTWPYNGESFDMWDLLIEQKIGMPHWDKVNYEVDLMVMDQLGSALNWISAGVSRLIGHIESFDKNYTNQMTLPEYTKMTLQKDYEIDLNYKELEDFLNFKKEFSVEIILSLNPSTKLEVLNPYLNRVDGVQFMGNDKIGYHGVDLDEKVLRKILTLRKMKPSLPIGIDIGVNFKTLEKLARAGVSRFSSGSSILKSINPRQTIIDMINVINSA